MTKKQPAPKAERGRPTKFTEGTRKKILNGIAMGATYELAAQYGGVAYNTFNEWMKKGEAEEDGEYRDFYEAIKQAEGKAAVGWLAKIEKAASDGSWQAAAWKIERRYPKEYGRTVQEQEHSGELKIKVEYKKPDGFNTESA